MGSIGTDARSWWKVVFGRVAPKLLCRSRSFVSEVNGIRATSVTPVQVLAPELFSKLAEKGLACATVDVVVDVISEKSLCISNTHLPN